MTAPPVIGPVDRRPADPFSNRFVTLEHVVPTSSSPRLFSGVAITGHWSTALVEAVQSA